MTNIQVLEYDQVHQKTCKITRQIFTDERKGIIVVITEWTECHCNGDEKV